MFQNKGRHTARIFLHKYIQIYTQYAVLYFPFHIHDLELISSNLSIIII